MDNTDTPKRGGTTRFDLTSEEVRKLSQQHRDLAEAMQRLIHFQHQTLVLKQTEDADAALDVMESLLIDVIDFTYACLHYRSDDDIFTPLRSLAPPNTLPDTSLLEWVMGKQEVSVVPVDIATDDGGRLRSQVFLPFGSHHILQLWLEQDAAAFTREQEALLSILAREMASVLDSHHFRSRLEKTRAAMSDIIESIPLGILAVDHHDKVAMINSTAEIALDVKRREAVGADYHRVLPEKVAQMLSASDTGGAGLAEEAELPIEKPGREAQFLGVTVSPVRSEDGSGESGQVVVCRDLQLSREVRKLRELDTMKNDFLSLVTHELRTPLTTIMGYSETLMLDDSAAMPPEWKEYINVIYTEGQRLCQLIDDVLDLTRMKAGTMTYNCEMQDPNELIGNVVMSMTPAIEEKRHELELDLDDSIGDCLLAVDRYHQVLTSVMDNAVKFTNPGGKIIVRSQKAAPFAESGAPTLLVTVEDNGIGIAPEHLDKVFSKFEMVEEVKNHTAGTGLSMAIGKQIIEDGHHGRIWLESTVGKGTKVSIRTPMA